VKGKDLSKMASGEFRNCEEWPPSPPPPAFFVSVASKGFSKTVSLLFATLARGSISVAAKGLKEEGERE